MPRSTLAIVQTGPCQLEARDLPLPEIGDEDALLRVEACGICGSDVEQYDGTLPLKYPMIPGHEPLGIVEKIGDRAARRWGVDVGDRIAVETMLPCKYCVECLGGRYHLCRSRQIYSYIPLEQAPGLWGAYAEYMYVAPTSIVHKIDPSLPAEIAVLFNPLGAGFRWAVEMPQLQPGQSVAILGPGQRGLASVIACREVGAGTICVTGLEADAPKLALAREFGADVTIDVQNQDARDAILSATDGGADVVIDVSAYATEPVAAALDYVKPGGTVVLAGVKGRHPVPEFYSDKIVMKEITIRGAIGVTSTGYREAIRLLESRRVPVAKMHTHDFDLRDAEEAILTLAGKAGGARSIHSCLIPGRA